MSVITYARSGGSYLTLTEREKALRPRPFAVEATNARSGRPLGARTATLREKIACRTRFGTARFTLNMSVKAVQTHDPKAGIDNFWELPQVKVWATDLALPLRHWCDAHITWDRGAKTVGKGTTNAPRLDGKLFVTVTDLVNGETRIARSLSYLPYRNAIRLG